VSQSRVNLFKAMACDLLTSAAWLIAIVHQMAKHWARLRGQQRRLSAAIIIIIIIIIIIPSWAGLSASAMDPRGRYTVAGSAYSALEN
jgi:hypothetical protein